MNKMYRKGRREFNASSFMIPSSNQSLMLFSVYFENIYLNISLKIAAVPSFWFRDGPLEK